ncbi:MAG TPA: hypothetical protein VJ826_04620 [Candidatus Polarisedimenticolaceae bacterium]|nr:hypothetical protein [Candidatus Polarisedimenticolaceae bacterium]
MIRRFAPIAALSALAACGLPPMLSDTGYLGTWSRGNDRNVSIVAIAQSGDRWLLRWTKRSFDGKLSVLCGWDGHCEERLLGELVATYDITTRYEDGKLCTDTIEKRTVPEVTTLQYTDVMEVTDGGRTLWNYTSDRNGEHYEGMARPMRSFSKVANAVVDPPK